MFVFIGGGSEFARVRAFAAEHGLRNILLLPYQPIETISASLSAADLHTVVMGEPFVGIVHTCKVYNILTLGVPFLYIGPERSHIMDLAPTGTAAVWMHPARHGEVERVRELIAKVRAAGPYPRRWEQAASTAFSQAALLPRMIREIEAVATNTPLPPSAYPPQPPDGDMYGDPEVIDSVLREMEKRHS